MKYVELFAGAGGLSRGLDAAGFTCTAHAEIEPHARAVLRAHWPDVPLYGDVSKLNGAQFRGITLLSGGSPCQDLSVAGKRAGLTGARSSLFHEQHRLWVESDAPYLLWENVLGALSSNSGRDFATILSTIVGAAIPVPTDGWASGGVAAGRTAVAAWRVSDLQHLGPPQRRTRVFVLAARTGGVDPAEVLALTESLCRHPAPREQARQTATGTLSARVRGGGGLGTDFDLAGGIVAFGAQNSAAQGDSVSVTPALDKSKVPAVCATGHTTHALTHEGADASEDGTGRGTPIVVALRGREGGSNAEVSEEVPSLRTPGGGSSHPIIVANCITAREAKGWNPARDVGNGTVQDGRPRRLMPIECERLMSWPDGSTQYGVKDDGTRYALSDTARYRLCGNGVASVQVEWIARRLADAITTQQRERAA